MDIAVDLHFIFVPGRFSPGHRVISCRYTNRGGCENLGYVIAMVYFKLTEILAYLNLKLFPLGEAFKRLSRIFTDEITFRRSTL